VKYIVEIAGEKDRHEVDLDSGSATLDGATATASLAEVAGTPVKLVTIGGVQHRVVARREGSKGSYVLWIDGWRFEVEALDERQRAIRDLGVASAAAAGPAPVVAPMPGLIVRVHVAVGDQVQAGQPVAVMEAMKMENELRATAAGTVHKVLVEAGRVVEKGAVLVELA
jgi:acetyl/propionyl-CoA carboxylase alpha subunit